VAGPEDAAPVRERAARWIAPLAFFAAALVLVLLIHSSLNGGSSSATTVVTSTPTVHATTTTAAAKHHEKRYYAVRAGDTLESIAARFHTTVDHLLSLNPKVDPLALTTGERVRVR